MIRLAHQHGQNDAATFDKIFIERDARGVDSQDLRRWKLLLKHWWGEELLDIGCGDSGIPSLMDQRSYHGVDRAQATLMRMQERYPDANYSVGDVYATGFQDAEFGYVVLAETLEHCDDPSRAIYEAVRVLKPGGTLAISVPWNEAREPGAVDKDHIYSFDKWDFEVMLMPYGEVTFRTLGSEWFPYRYHFPTLLAYLKKK